YPARPRQLVHQSRLRHKSPGRLQVGSSRTLGASFRPSGFAFAVSQAQLSPHPATPETALSRIKAHIEALLSRGNAISFSGGSRATRKQFAASNNGPIANCPLPGFMTSGHALCYDLIWDPCGLNAFLCFR